MNESVKKTIEALEKHNMKAAYFDDSDTAVSYLMGKIGDG